MPARTCTIYITPASPRHEPAFTLTVWYLLHHRQGWRQAVAFRIVQDASKADVVVSLVPHAILARRFRALGRPDLVGMSATQQRGPGEGAAQVWINAMRWMQGPDRAVTVAFPSGRLVRRPHERLDLYRTYLINHELGHALGIGHLPPRDGQCSIMTQQTRTLPQGARFQPWPEAEAIRHVDARWLRAPRAVVRTPGST